MSAATYGHFITLEGGEGAGKSTQAEALAASLQAIGLEVISTREPGGVPRAEAVRKLLLSRTNWDPIAEALLHFAARREHVARSIAPALATGSWVVCDRFMDSTLAYQGYGQGVPREAFDALAAMTLEGLEPDLTLVLDLPPEVGLARAAARGEADRYERLDLKFHTRVREGFRAIAAAAPRRCVVLDATMPPDAVAASVWAVVSARLPLPRSPPKPA